MVSSMIYGIIDTILSFLLLLVLVLVLLLQQLEACSGHDTTAHHVPRNKNTTKNEENKIDLGKIRESYPAVIGAREVRQWRVLSHEQKKMLERQSPSIFAV